MKTFEYRRRRYLFIPLILVAVAAFSAVTMILWNELMPLIFHLPTISFWQALGLLILGRLFFGGGRPYGWWGRNRWRHGLQERLSKMSPEEREEFYKKMRYRCRSWYSESPAEKEGAERDKSE